MCQQNRHFDLHLHTTASDGSLSPVALVELLVEVGVGRAAITDHDTLDGFRAATPEAARRGLDLVPALEISARWDRWDVHLLAYGIGHPERDDAFLAELRQRRWERIERVVALFRKTGFELTLEDLPPTSAPGRWHVAQALARTGASPSPAAALRRWLARGRRYDVRLRSVRLERAVDWIRGRGGVAVLAHPNQTFPTPERLEDALCRLGRPFEGLELFHPALSLRELPDWLSLARRWDLGVTGGSDFHRPGTGRLPGRGLNGEPLRSENLTGIFIGNVG